MKKIIITVLIATLASGLVACIPKKELPTEEEWKTYLLWEEEFLQWRDGPAKDLCVYQIQNKQEKIKELDYDKFSRKKKRKKT